MGNFLQKSKLCMKVNEPRRRGTLMSNRGRIIRFGRHQITLGLGNLYRHFDNAPMRFHHLKQLIPQVVYP